MRVCVCVCMLSQLPYGLLSSTRGGGGGGRGGPVQGGTKRHTTFIFLA